MRQPQSTVVFAFCRGDTRGERCYSAGVVAARGGAVRCCISAGPDLYRGKDWIVSNLYRGKDLAHRRYADATQASRSIRDCDERRW